jgi:hypothetical protein
MSSLLLLLLLLLLSLDHLSELALLIREFSLTFSLLVGYVPQFCFLIVWGTCWM